MVSAESQQDEKKAADDDEPSSSGHAPNILQHDPSIFTWQPRIERAETTRTQNMDCDEYPRRTVPYPEPYHTRGSDMTYNRSRAESSMSLRKRKDQKIVGLKNALRPGSETVQTIEEREVIARKNSRKNPFFLMISGNIAAAKVFAFYLITVDTIVVLALSIGLTLYWYFAHHDDVPGTWSAKYMDWFLVGFAVVGPMSASLTMSFTRREQALAKLSQVRSFAYHIYLGHALWDWQDEKGGRAGCTTIDWLEHSDAVMAQLVGICDELCRLLVLPTSTRSRHRMTKLGREEAAQTMDVAYRLFESLSTQRMTRLTRYAEDIKRAGLPAGEVSRIRQYERWLGESIEALRQLKMYRTPQALRSFARVFTLILPPFYAPTFAGLAIEVGSLGVGLTMAVIITLALTSLFESIQVLEDPFVAYLTLDGIDVREELEVLCWQQLVDTREIIFPGAPPFPEASRNALTPGKEAIRSDNPVDVELGALQTDVDAFLRVKSYQVDASDSSRNLGIEGNTSSEHTHAWLRSND